MMIRRGRQEGFSLIEALVAMVLISIASGALVAAITGASRDSAARFDTLTLALAAQDRLIRLEGATAPDAPRGQIDEGNVRWVYEIQPIAQRESQYGARLFQISLSVYTPENADAPRMKFETYVIRR